MDRSSKPAIVVDRTIAEYLEVLSRVTFRRFRIVEGIEQARALDGRLHYAVDASGLRQVGSFQDGGGDIDDVRELTAQAALLPDAFRPLDGHAVACAAEVRRHLLGPGERCVEGNRPAG